MVRRQIYTRQVPAERMHHGAQPLGHRFIHVGAVAQSVAVGASPQGQPSPFSCQGGCSSCGLPAAVRSIVVATVAAAVFGKGFGNGRTRRHNRNQANQHGPMILGSTVLCVHQLLHLAGVCQRELLSPRRTLSNALDGMIFVADSRWPGMRIMTWAAQQRKPQHNRGGGHRGCCQSR